MIWERILTAIRQQTDAFLWRAGKSFDLGKVLAHHLGGFKCRFGSGLPHKCCTRNEEETHFIYILDNGGLFWFVDDEDELYADVTSSSEDIAMRAIFSSGLKKYMEPPLMIIKNEDRNFRMQNILDIFCSRWVPHRSKGWINSICRCAWTNEL